jgi:rod shape-determining protein MreB and related proteins
MCAEKEGKFMVLPLRLTPTYTETWQSAQSFLTTLKTSSWRKLRKLFSQTLAIDLGTARTRIYAPGEGVVLDEPSLIAIHTETEEVIAVGEEARLLSGREPERVSVVQPLQSGVITDYVAVKRMLDTFIHKATRRKLRWRTHLLFATPSDRTPLELKAFRMAASDIGATKVSFVEEAVASAMGAEINSAFEHASVVIDIGAGTTDIAVVNAGEMVQGHTLRLGGNDLDQAIIRYLRQERGLETGPENAERIRINLFTLEENASLREMEIRGRNLSTRLPEFALITSAEVRTAILPTFTNITQFIRATLEELPLKPALDLLDTGVIICGGVALVPGLARWLANELNVGVYLAAEPQRTTIYGLARLLEHPRKPKANNFPITSFKPDGA